MSDADEPPPPDALPADVLRVLVEQSRELIAVVDAGGIITWANSRFVAATGLTANGTSQLGQCVPEGLQGEPTRRALALAIATGTLDAAGLRLRAAAAEPLWVDARARRASDQLVCTFTDVSTARSLAAEAQRQNELLETAQDFGRLGLWERRLPSGEGRWDRHVFGFWGLDPAGVTPSFAEAIERIHPEDRARMTFAESTRQAGRYAQRYRVIHPDGKTRWIHSQWEVKDGPDGVPDRVVGIMMDDTEVYDAARERVEQRRNAEELGRRLDAASRAAGMGLWATASDPPESDWNAQMYELFDGFSPPSVPGFSDWLRLAVHEADRVRVSAHAGAYLAHGEGQTEIEFRTTRRDGSVRWIVMRADRDPAAMPRRRILGVAMDVTEHHSALDALRYASERVSLIARYAGIGTWEVHADDSRAVWDEQMYHLRGLQPREGAPTRQERVALVHPDDLPLVLDSFDGSDLASAPVAYEFRVRMPDGHYRWLASRSAAVVDEHGHVLRRVGVNWDVTQSKEAELVRQQAALSEREFQAKSYILSRISHELRTPLNAVLGFTQLLQIEANRSGQPAQEAKLGHIRAAGGHLLSLINDILDLSGAEAGELRLAPRAVALDDLVRETVPLVESLAAQHDVAVEIHAAGGVARADPTRLRQVLINLLSNAIKYNRRGGRVTVQTRACGEVVKLIVQDNGRGLTASQVGALFEPFNRFGVESEGIEGTGIGLTIVKALIEGMGGTIAVESAPGKGTRFDVTLPAASASHVASAEPAAGGSIGATIAEAPPDRIGQILYIEDNPVNVMLVEELVRNVGALSVASETTGKAGVERARSLRPDLVLIDLQLPDFDGYEVLRRLRADPLTSGIPCIALSANAMPDDIARGLAAGFADYWTKPIDFPDFLVGLRKVFPAQPQAARDASPMA